MKKTALITGATSGIGEAIAYKLAENNYRLILTGRRKERLEEVKAELMNSFKAEVHILQFDIRVQEEVYKAIDSLPEEWATIDVLVNNAGLASGLSSIQEGDIDDWEKMIDTNIKGLLYVTRKVSPQMVARNEGHIINIGSTAGVDVYANGNVYCGTKHAVNAISKSMRIDMLKHKIKVTQIRPGMVNTEFSTVRFHGDKAKADSFYNGLTPLYAEDIADVVNYALSVPAHVNLNEIEVTCLAQANSYFVHRDE